MLQFPREEGGLALPHPRSYFLTAQMQHMKGSNLPVGGDSRRGIILAGVQYMWEKLHY